MDEKVNCYLIGLDLGEAQDYTAITILKQFLNSETHETHYEIPQLERVPLGTPYRQIGEYVKGILESAQVSGQVNGQSIGVYAPNNLPELCVDFTGAGRPVRQIFREMGIDNVARVVPISITGGQSIGAVPGFYTVSKRDIVRALEVLYQDGRLKLAKELEYAPVFVQELLNFKVKIKPKTGNDSFEAWRDRDHDDLVLSAAIAASWGESYRKY